MVGLRKNSQKEVQFFMDIQRYPCGCFAIPDNFCHGQAEEMEMCGISWMARHHIPEVNQLAILWSTQQSAGIVRQGFINGLVEIGEQKDAPRTDLAHGNAQAYQVTLLLLPM